jgi:hypothetical protein
MAVIPKGVNRFKLVSGVKDNVWEWKKGKGKFVMIKPVWKSSSKRYVSNWKVCARGVGVPKQRIFKTDDKALCMAIKLMRKK